MTDASETVVKGDDPPPTEGELAEQLRLRPALPPVTRLSRKVLIGLGGAASLGLGSVLIYALQGRSDEPGKPELYSTEGVAKADGLVTLPRDYEGLPPGVPKLGPPLPGDLGRPILGAEQRSEALVRSPQPTPSAPGPSTADQARMRATQERDAARTSSLFSSTQTSRAAPVDVSTNATPGVASVAPLAETSRAEAFLNRDTERRTSSADRVQAPASPYLLHAGSVIPAALVTGLRSDLPGQVVAQVTSPVHDSATGRHVLIPQGARLIGQYDAEIGHGQERVLLAWNRLIFPDGRSIVLERQPGADAEGFAGLEDRVDHHWGRLLRGAFMSTLLGVGAELGTGGDGDIAEAIREGAQDSLNQAGQQLVQRELGIRPTLTIRPGFPLRVLVTRDLILEPAGAVR